MQKLILLKYFLITYVSLTYGFPSPQLGFVETPTTEQSIFLDVEATTVNGATDFGIEIVENNLVDDMSDAADNIDISNDIGTIPEVPNNNFASTLDDSNNIVENVDDLNNVEEIPEVENNAVVEDDEFKTVQNRPEKILEKRPLDYGFSYNVDQEEHGNYYGHTENGVNDRVEGMYYNYLPNGRLIRVDYYVDGSSGFRPKITYINDFEPQWGSGFLNNGITPREPNK